MSPADTAELSSVSAFASGRHWISLWIRCNILLRSNTLLQIWTTLNNLPQAVFFLLLSLLFCKSEKKTSISSSMLTPSRHIMEAMCFVSAPLVVAHMTYWNRSQKSLSEEERNRMRFFCLKWLLKWICLPLLWALLLCYEQGIYCTALEHGNDVFCLCDLFYPYIFHHCMNPCRDGFLTSGTSHLYFLVLLTCKPKDFKLTVGESLVQ